MRIEALRAVRSLTPENLERHHDPRLSTVEAMAKALKVKPGKLLE